MNQKTLLHRVSFAVLTVLCCALQAQTTAPLATSPGDTKASLQVAEKTAKAEYASAVQACASKLAPAQCQRQAGLDYKQTQHAIKLRRKAEDVASKQAKNDKAQADKAQNAATAKQGLDPAGKPLERAPLSKQQTAKSNIAPKQPMAKKETPKAKPTGPKKPLTVQPTPGQRRANVATVAKKEIEIASRKTQAQSKQAKRAKKDAQRRAAGYTVDKPLKSPL